MRDLHKILNLFAHDFVMDYCQEFDELKSVLEHCDKHVKPFNKVYFRGGNEPFINELSSRLQKLLLDRHYVDEKTKEPVESAYNILRKITMFLFANTDTTYKYNLSEDPILGHVLELCPLLPKFLLVTMVWELKLDRFFYEVLSYTPCWFSFQYFEAASDSMKYIDDPFQVLEKVNELVMAIYLSITRSDLRQIEAVDRKIIFGKMYDYTMNFLRQFYTPDAEKFKKFKKLQFFKYSGFAIKHLLEMIIRCFDIYEQPQKSEPLINVEIYDICQKQCKKLSSSLGESSTLVKEYLLKIIMALLNSLQYNVMLVKIDVFMHWVEVDLSDTVNLQMSIGELAYRVGERMLSNRTFGHDVEQQLRAIAIRPKTLEETIRDSTLGDILRSLDEELPYKEKKMWFDQLINRTMALGNDECLNSIKDNIKLMTVENCQQILDYIKLESERNKHILKEDENMKIEEISNVEMDETESESTKMEIDPSDYEDISSIVIQALDYFKPEEILTLISYEIKIFGENTTVCCHSASDFKHRATEFLNKYTSSFDFHQFLILCFEHPKLMWEKFFDSACESLEHVTNFCTTVRDSRPSSNLYFQNLITEAVSDISKMQEKFFPELLCEIYFTLYFPERKTEFLKQFVSKNVNDLLDSQRFAGLLPIIKTLNLISSRSETHSHKPLNFGEVTAPVLLVAAQIMEKARWDLVTYTDERDAIVSECIQFIQNTSKKFLPVATDKDRKWIKGFVDLFDPTTMYYFQKFSLSKPTVDFDRYMFRVPFKDAAEVQLSLLRIFVRCTMKETEWLARSDRLLPHMSDIMIILGGVVTEMDNCNAVNNYRHCMINYANIVTKFLLPQTEHDVKKLEKLQLKVLKILDSSPVDIYNEMFMNFEWLLLEISKKYPQPFDESMVGNVRKYVADMRDCKAKHIFLEKFQAITTE